jgi:hypothetical protein
MTIAQLYQPGRRPQETAAFFVFTANQRDATANQRDNQRDHFFHKSLSIKATNATNANQHLI